MVRGSVLFARIYVAYVRTYLYVRVYVTTYVASYHMYHTPTVTGVARKSALLSESQLTLFVVLYPLSWQAQQLVYFVYRWWRIIFDTL